RITRRRARPRPRPYTTLFRSTAAARIAQYETKSVELREICRSIAELLERGTPASSIGIVARSLDPYDVALLNRYAAEFGFRTSEDRKSTRLNSSHQIISYAVF